jgi:MFS family permease
MALSGFPAIRSAMSNRNYRYYTAGNILSHFGSWIQRIAMGWLAWELEESGLWLGVVAIAELGPAVILAPFAGAIADRIDRLRGIRSTQALALLQAMALAAVTYLGLASIAWLIVLAFVRGVIMAFNQPFRFVVLPSLVERKDLPAAIAINSLSFNIARILGPAVAAGLIAQWGVATAFTVNALTFLVFIVTLFAIKLENPFKAEPRPLSNIPFEILEGMRYCVRMPGIAQMFFLMAVVAMFGRAYVELMPGFADDVFGRGVDGLGILHSAIGGGAIFAGILLTMRGGITGLVRLVGWMVLLVGVGLIGFTATSNFWFAVVSAALTGFGMVIIGVGEQQLIQNAVAGNLRGRVMSLYGMISRGGPALGALLMGAASEWVGLRIPVAIGGLICFGLCFWVFARSRDMAEALEGEADGSGR